MSKILKTAAILALLLSARVAFANEKIQGYCTEGGVTLTIPGVGTISQKVMGSWPGCTVTVFNPSGSFTLATLYSDNSNSPKSKSNPFTADAITGLFYFYTVNSRIDVRFSGAGIPIPFVWSDILVFDPADVVSAGALTVYNIQNYGAVAGALQVSDGAMLSASKVLTSATGLFVCANITSGVTPIHVEGAGASGIPLLTTIASCQGATQVTLTAANASGGNLSGASVTWGGTTAEIGASVQLAVNAACAATGGIIYFPPGAYFQSTEAWDVYDTRSGAGSGVVCGNNASRLWFLGAVRGTKVYLMGNLDHYRTQTIVNDNAAGPQFSNIEFSGPNSFASAVAIHYGDTTSARFDELSIHDMIGTGSIGLWEDNANSGSGVQWTERTYIGHVQLSDNTIGWDLSVNGGTNSHAYDTVEGLHVTTVGSGFVGIQVESGAVCFGCKWNGISGNVASGQTLVSAIGQVLESTINITGEGGGYMFKVATTGAVTGTGIQRGDGMPSTVTGNGELFITPVGQHNTLSTSTLGQFDSRNTYIYATTDLGAPPLPPAAVAAVGGDAAGSNADFLFGFNTGGTNDGRAAARGLQCPVGQSAPFLWSACTQVWDIDSQGMGNFNALGVVATSLPDVTWVPSDSSVFMTQCASGQCSVFFPNLTTGIVAMTYGQTVSISPGAISARTCVDVDSGFTGANLTMALIATPVGPLDSTWNNVSWSAYMKGNGHADVHVCNPTSGSVTPVATNFVERVIQ